MSRFIPSPRRARTFFNSGLRNGYSMAPKLIHPERCAEAKQELIDAGYHRDKVELIDTKAFFYDEMPTCAGIHHELNARLLSRQRGVPQDFDNFPLFSVRVFRPNQIGTTIHRNYPTVGPWIVGITLSGEAPFNTYEQEQLEDGEIIPLTGESDPIPLDTLPATTGSAWSLYSGYDGDLVPHSSGMVGDEERTLLILYGICNYPPFEY